MSNDPNADTIDFVEPTPRPEIPRRLPGSLPARVDLGSLSHPGKCRPNNEDTYLAVHFERALWLLKTNLPEGTLPALFEEGGYGLLVADGIGGLVAGEVASRLAATTLVELALQTPDWILRLDEPEWERMLQRFAWRFREVDAALKREARIDPKLAGMGTTLTVACTLGTGLLVAHVGDSRAYLFRQGGLRQLTRDHTVAQGLADEGLLTPEQLATHPLRHLLTRALGGPEGESEADVLRGELQDGDQILLCTDGLTEMVTDAEIAALLRKAPAAQEACQALVDAALAAGGKDNVTVVLARYRFPPAS